MPNQSLQQAAQDLQLQPLAPEVRRLRERELKKIRRREMKEFEKRLNDRLAKAKDGYKAVNEAQYALDDEYEDLRSQEGRISAGEYQARLQELNAKQQRLEQQRNLHRTTLVSVGDAMDELEEDPDSVIDEFYGKYDALHKPTRDLSW